ncbi:SIP domain-containing protein [Amycolatopsis umgeniensis]|uniref:NADPH-dependent ferric siderophore reductase n=1 Tax=Amycolatopsis umgeniensis TaxID=336628 RepID=A0A841AW43_9PSEU|nr:siderophore-interacting protein [Amycolatopsis umgeniensis]MBB5850514.1 NADPH-dependent ferric siderophore reductase [Amycolatopsis umgeniensis]
MPRPKITFPITLRTLEVLRVEDVTEGMRRVVLGGERLAPFRQGDLKIPAFRSDGFDDEFKLFFTEAGRIRPVLPAQGDGVLKWPRDPAALARTYTVRRYDERAGEVSVDIVRHAHGIASAWAETCRPGDEITVAGPKMSYLDPVDADWLLVLGDETALPAIGRWLEELAPGTRAQVFVEIGEDSHRQDLTSPPDVRITWLSRAGAPAGSTTLLFDAARSAEWWPGRVYAWAAGEALSMQPIRRWLRNDKGLSKEDVEVVGYWRRREGAEPEDDRLHELTEIVPPFALRVAVTAGLTGALAHDRADAATLATRAGTHPAATARLARYLVALEVFDVEEGRYGLTALGRELLDEDVAADLDLESAAGVRELSITGLLDAVRSGPPPVAPLTTARAASVRIERDYQDRRADAAGFLAPLVAPGLADTGHVHLVGEGLGPHASALLSTCPDLRVTVSARPSEKEGLPDGSRLSFRVGGPLDPAPPGAGTVLLVEALGGLPDADAEHALRRAAESGEVIVVEEPLPVDPDEHDLEDDLLALCAFGSGKRTDDELRALFTAAGLTVADARGLGWGYFRYSLR